MASVSRRNYKGHVERSQSMYVQSRERKPPRRFQSVKEDREPKVPGVLNIAINSKMLQRTQNLYQRRRGAHRVSIAITDSNRTHGRTSSSLLAFYGEPGGQRGGGRLKHAKSCEFPRKLRLEGSQSSDESCDVTASNLNHQSTTCEITQLHHSPTSHRRRVWTMPSPGNTPPDSPHCSSRTQSPAAQMESVSPFLSPIAPLRITPVPDVSMEMATHLMPPVISLLSPSHKLKKLHHRIRGCQSTSALAYRTANSNLREHIIQELIETERRFITNLETLLNTYLPAVEETVAARDLRLLFPGQLEVLLDWHKLLLTQLEGRKEERGVCHSVVGDIFGQLCSGNNENSEFINMYSAYMNEFKVAMQTLAKYEHSSTQFQQDVRSCQQSAECEGLSLASYLLTPVQRLPRYELLLKELLKHTPLDHPDNSLLEEAVDLLREELTRLNSSIKSCQLACSVTKIRNGTSRSRSFRRLGNKGRIAGKQFARQLIKHLSAVSIDDLSSTDARSSPEMVGGVQLRRRERAVSIQAITGSSLYRSEENLPSLPNERKERALSVTESMMMGIKATSCIDLAADYDHVTMRKMRRHSHALSTLESEPATPEPTSPTSVLPFSEAEDSCPGYHSRTSVYSTTSSGESEGIGSANSQLDLNSTLTITPTPTHSPPPVTSSDLTPTNPPTTATSETPHRPLAETTPTQRRWKKTLSWASSIVQPLSSRMKKSESAQRTKSLSNPSTHVTPDISLPLDFRHVQHGFINTTPNSVHPLPS